MEDLKEQESVSRILAELLENQEEFFDSEDDDVSTTDYSSINEQVRTLLFSPLEMFYSGPLSCVSTLILPGLIYLVFRKQYWDRSEVVWPQRVVITFEKYYLGYIICRTQFLPLISQINSKLKQFCTFFGG